MRTRLEMQANLLAILDMPESFTTHDLAKRTGWISESARMLLARYVRHGLLSMVDVPCTTPRKDGTPSTGYMRYYSLTDKGHEVIAEKAAKMTLPPVKGIKPMVNAAPRRIVNSVFQWGQV